MPRKTGALMAAARGAALEVAAPKVEIQRPSQVLPPEFTGVVAVDTESSGLHVDDGARCSTVSVSFYENGVLRTFAFPFDQGEFDKDPAHQMDLFEQADPNLPREEWDWLLAWLDRDLMFLVMHNAKHDLHQLRTGTRRWPGRDLMHRFHWDTALACKDLWPTYPVELKGTCQREFGVEPEDQRAVKGWLKARRMKMGDMDKVPWSIMASYAGNDTDLTVMLYRHQADLYAAGEGDKGRLLRQFEVMKVLYLMEQRGIGYDVRGSLEAADLIEDAMSEIWLPFEPTDVKAKKYFFKEQGLDRYGTVDKKKGTVALDEEATWRMTMDGVPYAAEWARWTKLHRAYSMWYKGYPKMAGPDGRLRTSYRQTQVKSGRKSVERVNLQAIPKDDKTIPGIPGVRSFVRPREGYELWNMDLSQAELRVATQYAGCKRMREMLEAGEDLHSWTCETVLGVPRNDPNFKYHRDIAKRLTFGGIFQIGGETFQKTLAKQAHVDMPLEQCVEIVRGWRSQFWEFGRAYRQSEEFVQRNGYVELLPGTEYRCQSWFTPNRDWPQTGWSRRVQGSLAEFLDLWLLEAERISGGFKPDGPLVLTVHDSLVLETPIGEGETLAREIADWAGREATRLFGIKMLADVGPWHK